LICPRLKAPIVLAHGLFGFGRIGVGPLTVAAYFRVIPDLLRAGGNRVVETRVHPTAGVGRRAAKLGERILAAFRDEPVHIIGHSMGGLDARQLLTDPAWHAHVLSLTTIGTPHLGSTFADAARDRLAGVYRVLDSVGLDYRGFLDLMPDAALAWHNQTPAPDGIRCFSVAGNPTLEQVCWPLRPLHALLERREGPNDGLVSVVSAEAFGNALPACPVDHLRQMNWMTIAARGGISSEVLALYVSILDNLVALGFGDAGEPAPAVATTWPTPAGSPLIPPLGSDQPASLLP
jgi:triacylglycerol lipase